ncbi:MAG: HAD hydrolase-like protein [Boseongicola sp.]|nr:HAD hydrolase-like protein [Boseongicola sp.]
MSRSDAREPSVEVARHAPVLRFDAREPFLPRALGYVIHEADGMSASADHSVALNGAAKAIEFAIWWDWDIQHLYELEHVWVYVDGDNAVVRVEASAHGTSGEMWRDHRQLPVEHGRIVLYSEPGKHAFAADPALLRTNLAITTYCCRDAAGAGEILVPGFLDDQLGDLTHYDRHLARRYMRGLAFKPAFRFDTAFDLRDVPAMPWQDLRASIPGRMRAELARLRREAKGVKAVLLDSGDTLIDEASQVFTADGVVLCANPVPGGDRLVAELKRRGYLVALVADGRVQSFENVHRALGFWDLFDARAISEQLGLSKPDPLMFEAAAAAMGLTAEDYGGCVMVGNNLARDIAGANRLGMRSVWINWGDNYPKTPACDDEIPEFEVRLPHEILDVLDRIEGEVPPE